MTTKKIPVFARNNHIIRNTAPQGKRVFISIPLTGIVRAEWAMARYGQAIPCNWSHAENIQWIDTAAPLGYTVADARNVAVDNFVKSGYEWLFFIDHDVILPPNTFIAWNQRMLKGDVPIWGGLYFAKGCPSEPLLYREWGCSYHTKWKLGDEVWVKGMGMGCNVLHQSIMATAYNDSPKYQVGHLTVRKVFETPSANVQDPDTGCWGAKGGTEDITFYDRLINEGLLEKAGWPKYQKMKYPYLCDTSIFCKHIAWDGVQYPAHGEEQQYMRKGKKNGKSNGR